MLSDDIKPDGTMRGFLADHFMKWLEGLHPADQHSTEEAIYCLLRDYPELVNHRSWPEIRMLAER